MKSIPEVLDTFAQYADVAAVQIRVPLNLNLNEVVNHLTVDLGYRMSTFPDARLIFIPFAAEELATQPVDHLKSVKRRAREAIIYRYTPVARKESVETFLADLAACSEGRAFAADCDSIAQIWDKMVREKRWDFLNYVISFIRDHSKLYRQYVVNQDAWNRVCRTYQYANQRGHKEWYLLTEEALLNMNPFSR